LIAEWRDDDKAPSFVQYWLFIFLSPPFRIPLGFPPPPPPSGPVCHNTIECRQAENRDRRGGGRASNLFNMREEGEGEGGQKTGAAVGGVGC